MKKTNVVEEIQVSNMSTINFEDITFVDDIELLKEIDAEILSGNTIVIAGI